MKKNKEFTELLLVGRIVTGKTPSTKDISNFGNKYPFITPRDMNDQKYIFSTERYLSEKGKNSVINILLVKDSVCVSCIGSHMGKVVMTTTESVTNQQLNSIIVNENHNPHFVYYSLKYISKDLRNAAFHSTAVPILNKTQFSKFKIYSPPLPEQRAIADILSSLDDKIELNNRMNKTLEQMARAIFKQWFIDYEFPCVRNDSTHQPSPPAPLPGGEGRAGEAKNPLHMGEGGPLAVGEGTTYKSSGGKMIDSELGMIPEGWRISTLGDVCKRITDGSHFSPKSVDIGLPMASVKDMEEWGFNLSSCRLISEEDFNDLVRNDCRPLANDVLIAKDGSYLKHIFVVERDFDVVILSSIAILRPNENIDPHLLAFILRNDETMNMMEQYVSGAVLQRIVLKDFRKFPIILPPKDIQQKWTKIVVPLIQLCWRNVDENKCLMALRDTLLPKLMSGELRVPPEKIREYENVEAPSHMPPSGDRGANA